MPNHHRKKPRPALPAPPAGLLIAAWHFTCARGHQWFEPYGQEGVLAQVKPCVVRTCASFAVHRGRVDLGVQELVA